MTTWHEKRASFDSLLSKTSVELMRDMTKAANMLRIAALFPQGLPYEGKTLKADELRLTEDERDLVCKKMSRLAILTPAESEKYGELYERAYQLAVRKP